MSEGGAPARSLPRKFSGGGARKKLMFDTPPKPGRFSRPITPRKPGHKTTPAWSRPWNIQQELVRRGDDHPISVRNRQFRMLLKGHRDEFNTCSGNTQEKYGDKDTVRWLKVDGFMSVHGDLFMAGKGMPLEEMQALALDVGAVAFTMNGWFKHTIWPQKFWTTSLDGEKMEKVKQKMTMYIRETEVNRWDRNRFWGRGLSNGTQIEAIHTMGDFTGPDFMDQNVLEHIEHLCRQGLIKDLQRWTHWQKGGTLLHTAAGRGYPMVTKFLLEHGWDPNYVRSNLQNSDNCTPLHCAAFHASASDDKEGVGGKQKRLAIARLLLGHGANPNLKNKYGESPIDLVPDLFKTKATGPQADGAAGEPEY